jgi:D-xylose transport system permease protein
LIVPLTNGFAGWMRRGTLDTRLLGMSGALIVVWLCFDRASEGLFLTPRNLYNLAVQSSMVGVMACGMVMVIVGRHIDLSVGSVLGVTGMSVAFLQVDVFPAGSNWGWPVAVLAAVTLGGVIGAAQGWWVAYRGVPAFVVTLGGLMIFRGAAYLVTDGRTVAPLDPRFERLGGGLEGAIGVSVSWSLAALAALIIVALALRVRYERSRHGVEVPPVWVEVLRAGLLVTGVLVFVGVMNAHTLPGSDEGRGIPHPVLVLIAVALSVHVLARSTRFGRHVYAMGGSPMAAERAGIDLRRVTVAVFSGMGVLAGIAGVLTSARLGAGTSSMGTLSELAVIAAAVIGGTSLTGGVGSVAGAVLGAVMMQSLENGMVLMGVSSAVRQVGIGAVLVIAVWLDSLWTRRGSGR